MKKKIILSFESSCDDTGVAVIDTDYKVLSNIVSSQFVHQKYGGVVPELASRDHLKNITRVCHKALQTAGITTKDVDAVAVSVNPGLIGALLVGVSFAKALAYAEHKPLIAVNHLLGHLAAIRLDYPKLTPPYLALIVSGGHTQLAHFLSSGEFKILGGTVDDAAGEAFDKSAKILNLGYPGGKLVDDLAKQGDPKFVHFTRALNKKGNFNFSFSGLKTAIMNYVNSAKPDFVQNHLADIAASIQESIVDSLYHKTMACAKAHQIDKIVVAGGVSANSRLRAKFGNKAYFPSFAFCTDNAAMIGAAAVELYQKKEFANLELNAFSTKGIRNITSP